MSDLVSWAQSLHDEPHHARCAIHDGGECDCYRTTRSEYPMADEVLALLSRLEKLEAAAERVVSFHAPDIKSDDEITRPLVELREALSQTPPTHSHEDRYMKEERGGLFSQAIGMARLALRDGDAEKALLRLDEACEEAHAKHREALVRDGWPKEHIDRFFGESR